jgi:phosphosulfolactate synthase
MAGGDDRGHDGFGGAWNGVCPFPLLGRTRKPRERGLTMVIDTGLGLAATADALELAGPYVDLWKLAFGTTAFYSERLLCRKLELAAQAGVVVYPGGTYLEVAVVQSKGREFIERAAALGFGALEVSDGTIQMSGHTRRGLIEIALAHGMRVVTEVGKKHPADRVPRSNIREQIAADLRQGAWRVIVEGRESGKGVVIYRDDGSIDEEEMEDIAAAVDDPSRLIWEAPLKSQQQDLILRFGPNVNLGNVHVGDALALEALRVGLRGDTLRAAILSSAIPSSNHIDEGEEGAVP